MNYPIYWEYIERLGRAESLPFKRAIEKPLQRFEKELIKNLVDAETYFPVADRNNVWGRNQSIAERVADGRVKLKDNSLFANRLTKTYAVNIDGKLKHPTGPSERVVLYGLFFYTFEFDIYDLNFFRRQISWVNWSGKELNCPIGKLFKECSKWIDFRGITVCWSGAKSLHIHIAFDTEPFVELFGETINNPRRGFIKQWESLEPVVRQKLGLTGTDYYPDRQLRLPEQYRRLPNGHRNIEKENLLGIPLETRVQQITLWEKWIEARKAVDATGLFHLHTNFAELPVTKVKVDSKPKNGGCPDSNDYTDQEISYCELRLRTIYPDTGWPKLHKITFKDGSWVASFFNNSEDKNPSSIMRGEYSTIMFAGHGANGLVSKRLDAPLSEMMRRWAQDYNANGVQEIELDAPNYSGISKIERLFSLANSFHEARHVLVEYLWKIVVRERNLLIHAPEGASKTTTLMKSHSKIANFLATTGTGVSGETRRAMYAFGNYDEANNKCDAFNKINASKNFFGIVIKSFSKSYEEACKCLGLNQISKQSAVQRGFLSQWVAIEKEQPEIIDWFKDRHKKLWDQIGDRQPVFFTVHQVAHTWHLNTRTRLIWAPSYWNDNMKDRAEICRSETRLSILIHDEIHKSTFVDMISEKEKDWIDGLRSFKSSDWQGLSVKQKEEAFRDFRNHHHFPIDYHRAMTIADTNFNFSVTVQDTHEYNTQFGERDIYATSHGQKWWISPRTWWKDIDAQRIVFLTTEEVPTALAEKVDPNIQIIRLDPENLPRHVVDVHMSRSVVSSKLQKQINKWREKNGDDWMPISNKLDNGSVGTNHARAKGSNEFQGRKIVQTMTFLSKAEYEEIQAFNAYCNREDLILLRHVDEFNQTSGRNLGFRYSSGAEHVLLVSGNLFDQLIPKLGYSRYDLRVHMDAEQRREYKRKRLRAQQREKAQSAHSEVSDQISPPATSGTVDGTFPMSAVTQCRSDENSQHRLAS